MIHVRELTKTYSDLRHGQFVALSGISFDAYPGEVFGLLGPNGAGKSTFMNLVGCLDTATSGHYALSGTPVEELEDDELAELRNGTIGFVFQTFQLLPRKV